MTNKDVQAIQKTVVMLVKSVASRNKDIVSRRFGLQNGKKETLESIGKGYGITRERVRQIEEATLAQLAKAAEGNRDVEKYAALAKGIVAKDGGVMKERDLFAAFSGSEKDSVANASLAFILSLNKDFVRFSENDRFYAFWSVNAGYADAFRNSVSGLVSVLEKNKGVVHEKAAAEFSSKNGVKGFDGGALSDKGLSVVLAVSKDLRKNIYGELGLASWSEIRPKGVKDKAYLILKKLNQPKHFSEIAKLINGTNFGDGKKVNLQTVHNELIKDNRFVLVGRGLYALAEWGYKSGTVKDVLVDVLKDASKPLSRAELVSKVLDARMVKETTIHLNLQDSTIFSKNSDGAYVLKKA